MPYSVSPIVTAVSPPRTNACPVHTPSIGHEHGIDVPRLVRVLCELGRVKRLAELGTNGPLLASAGRESLYHCLFGRDSLRMAMDLLDDFPSVARATLLDLARLQGTSHNARRDEEPGRILHEHRHPDDPNAQRLADFMEFPYYGTVDATPQWINLLASYCQRVDSYAVLNERLVNRDWHPITLRESLIAALRWILGRINDPIGGGYLWVRRKSERGIANQVWEDSGDSHYFEDGTLFDSQQAYAPVAVQGYAYDALLAGAALLETPGGPCELGADQLRRHAVALRARVLAYFWQPDLGTFAQALVLGPHGSARPARVIASSPGHLLASRLLDGPDAAPFRACLIARFGESDLLGGAGIRTKSTTAVRFRAGSYHNGSIWPMDTGVIADGLRRHGARSAADDLDRRTLKGCQVAGGLPEFLCGDVDGSVRANTEIIEVIQDGVPNRIEQPPQAEQGWTATRVWRILRQHGWLVLRD